MKRYLFVVVAMMSAAAAWAADVSVSGRVLVKDDNKSVDVVFTNKDKTAIRDYYRVAEVDKEKRNKDKKVPPGLAKKGGLPPGIAKKQRLPENVAYEPLPRALEAKLPPLPSPNFIRVKVGQDFAILDKSSRVIFDMAIGLGN
jgi:hypothetical protein